ncbi:MAG TPA: NAD(P)-dependent oxidoreductase [Euzebyales bacterium]|nr:NAD(P)-dependent oxidoreductase [Euzebyales bacterium]
MAPDTNSIGWIGIGRMGLELATRLLRGGHHVAVWNRTREKAEPLAELGATIVDTPADLASCDIVVTMVSSSDVFELVTLGDDGLLTRSDVAPKVLVDSSTISEEASERVRAAATRVGTQVLAAPVSGNPKVVKSGRLTTVASGPQEAFDLAEPVLAAFGQNVTYVGDGDAARLVKICHHLLLGVVTQTLAEITILAEKGGVARSDFLDFINGSVMGSIFSRYKTPSIVNLDYRPTFTSNLLRKDFELGLAAARDLDVPLPTAALVHQLVTALIGNGHGEDDFVTLLEMQARGAGHTLEPEDIEVSDGLEPVD